MTSEMDVGRFVGSSGGKAPPSHPPPLWPALSGASDLGLYFRGRGGGCGCVLNRIPKRNLPREINRNALTTQAGEVDKDLHRFWGGSPAEKRRPTREAFVAAVADWLGELGSVRKLKVTTP